MTGLVILDAGYFYAWLVFKNGVCVKAAPIIKWAVGKHENYLSGYALARRWTIISVRSS